MKSVFVIGMMVAAATAFAAAPANKAADKAAKEAAKKLNEEFRALQKSQEQLLKEDFKRGLTAYWHVNSDTVIAKWREALKDPKWTNAQRLEMLETIAKIILDVPHDEKQALAVMEEGLKLPGLGEADTALAKKKLDALRARIESDGSPKPGPTKEEIKARLDGYRRMLAGYDGKQALKDNEFRDILCEDWAKRGIEALKAEFPEVAKAIVAKNSQRVKNAPSRWLFSYFANIGWRESKRSFKYNPEARQFVVKMLGDKAYGESMPSDVQMMNFANGTPGLESVALTYAMKIVEASRAEGAKIDKKALRTATEMLAFKGAEKSAPKTIEAIRKMLEFDGKADDRAELAKQIGKFGAKALKAGDEKLAREFLEEYLKIVPDKHQSRLDCPYWADAPHDLAKILESDRYQKAEKGLLSHRYGDNLKSLIETDSALMGREMTTDKGEKFRPTELFAFFDAYGVKLVLRSFEDMSKVKAGFGSPASYESYLAPGVEAPYWCYMFSPREDGGDVQDGFWTQYANDTGHRVSCLSRHTLKISSLYFDDGAATMIEVPWHVAFRYTPDHEKAWFFEPINWAHGGRSWGGSRSVHYRSSFGMLEFKGADKAALTAIRRLLLPKAKAVFDNEVSSRNGGSIDRWEDPELGDQEFYLAKVKPFKDRLAAALKGVKPEMTDDEVNAIYESVGEDAFNTRYLVARLRTEWLEEKRVRGE